MTTDLTTPSPSTTEPHVQPIFLVIHRSNSEDLKPPCRILCYTSPGSIYFPPNTFLQIKPFDVRVVNEGRQPDDKYRIGLEQDNSIVDSDGEIVGYDEDRQKAEELAFEAFTRTVRKGKFEIAHNPESRRNEEGDLGMVKVRIGERWHWWDIRAVEMISGEGFDAVDMGEEVDGGDQEDVKAKNKTRRKRKR